MALSVITNCSICGKRCLCIIPDIGNPICNSCIEKKEKIMKEYCKHHKRVYKNGELITNKCLKLKSNIPTDGNYCENCGHNTTKNEKKSVVLFPGKEQINKDELFKTILESTFKMMRKQMEDFNKRLKKIEKTTTNTTWEKNK